MNKEKHRQMQEQITDLHDQTRSKSPQLNESIIEATVDNMLNSKKQIVKGYNNNPPKRDLY